MLLQKIFAGWSVAAQTYLYGKGKPAGTSTSFRRVLFVASTTLKAGR
jgi:hypothetical protein